MLLIYLSRQDHLIFCSDYGLVEQLFHHAAGNEVYTIIL